MFTVFVSHQWLGAVHPDPDGRQFAILRETLQGIVNGSLEVEADPITVLNASLEKVDAETREAGIQNADFECFLAARFIARLQFQAVPFSHSGGAQWIRVLGLVRDTTHLRTYAGRPDTV